MTHKLHRMIETLWWSQTTPPLLLRIFEPLYRAISNRHLEKRASNPYTAPIPLISVGNITVGGSGKTPFTLWLAQQLEARGYQPVILCRGDGGHHKHATVVTNDMPATTVGDEARMLANLASSPVVVAADRILGSKLAATLGNVIILDDGFQYCHLARCCDLVLIPDHGIGNGHLIPAGPLREPPTALQRADLIIRTGNMKEEEANSTISTYHSHEWLWKSNAVTVTDIKQSNSPVPTCVHAVTSIARPERFFKTVETEGFKITTHTAFPDHYQFTSHDIEKLLATGEPVITTEKDAVKLSPLWHEKKPLWVVKLRGEGEPGLLQAILQYL